MPADRRISNAINFIRYIVQPKRFPKRIYCIKGNSAYWQPAMMENIMTNHSFNRRAFVGLAASD